MPVDSLKRITWIKHRILPLYYGRPKGGPYNLFVIQALHNGGHKANLHQQTHNRLDQPGREEQTPAELAVENLAHQRCRQAMELSKAEGEYLPEARPCEDLRLLLADDRHIYGCKSQ